MLAFKLSPPKILLVAVAPLYMEARYEGILVESNVNESKSKV